MALMKCVECEKEFSSTVKACPHCGAKKSKNVGVVGIVGALLFGATVYQCSTRTPAEVVAPTTSTPVASALFTRNEADGACLIGIKKNMRDPSTAEFEHSRESTIVIRDNHALVIRKVRGVNGYGAKSSGEFLCLLEKSGEFIMPVAIAEKEKVTDEMQAIIKRWKLL